MPRFPLSGPRIELDSMHLFLIATDFIGQTKSYFQELNLHLDSDIHTIGKIVYTSNNIVLKPIADDKEVILSFLCDQVPEHGTYVHLYGNFSFFNELGNATWTNFDDYTESIILVLNVVLWKDLKHETFARKLEQILYTLNYKM
ncbi:hypothetical protein NQ315_005873 [Exocentrus adspersus]|uniref:Uncharacterized protein n=1 Tax=Exocentrus adspersus TaxID=1586481 RepID=A0AAV8VSF6_9CUCU|nr:hypothetical protein NQ315_005873 [Exocentrus adspersus]